MVPLPWWRRLNVEIGGRWQMLPDKNTSWRQWIISPGCRIVWPGKKIDPLKDMPGDLSRSGYIDMVTHPLAPGETLRRSEWFARFFWATCYLRVLGLDLGAAVLWLKPAKEKPHAS